MVSATSSIRRALLLAGHGYPVFFPYGKLNPQNPSIRKAVTIGDVGVVASNGIFRWLFNIFLPADRPTQIHAPDSFQPFEPPPSESDISFIPKFHKPGTIITSAGVNVDIRSREPWNINFTSDKNQAGMLFLQRGADRYDLVSTEPDHEYIAKHATHWYQIANEYASATFPNGSLIVVTGYDSCDHFSHTQYCPEPEGEITMDLTFTQSLEKHQEGSELKAIDAPLTVFVRGIRVSLSERIWRSILPAYGFSPDYLHCTLVASPPSNFGSRRQSRKSTFQPNFLIGQILLGQYPEASFALVEDQIWCSFVQKDRPCTLPELNRLISRVFAACHIVEYRGTVKLVPKEWDTTRQRLPEEQILAPPASWARRKEDDDWVRHVPLPKWPWL